MKSIHHLKTKAGDCVGASLIQWPFLYVLSFLHRILLSNTTVSRAGDVSNPHDGAYMFALSRLWISAQPKR